MNVNRAPDEPLFTTKEVAKRLRLKVETVQHYIRTSQLKAAKIGRSYLVASGDLDEFIRSRKK